jgi:hypothetical protein
MLLFATRKFAKNHVRRFGSSTTGLNFDGLTTGLWKFNELPNWVVNLDGPNYGAEQDSKACVL